MSRTTYEFSPTRPLYSPRLYPADSGVGDIWMDSTQYNGRGTFNMNSPRPPIMSPIGAPLAYKQYYEEPFSPFSSSASADGDSYKISSLTLPSSSLGEVTAPRISRRERTLKDMRAVSQYSGFTIEDVYGNVPVMARDQQGCRFLQAMLDGVGGQWIEVIYTEILHGFAELMMDPFGNYLCQKLCECCDDNQRGCILHSVVPHISAVSCDVHGTRSMQRLIESIANRQQVCYMAFMLL